MKKEQEGLLLLLKEIDYICRKHNITYYVSGGTVLGAVRHEGFIPWDDDIDVYMTRDNWNKFRAVMKTQVPDRRALECWEDNEQYYNLLGRYINKDTTQIHKYQLYSDTAMGQVVDVFVLDPVINDEEVISQHRNNVMLASDLINDFAIYSDRAASCEEYKQLRARVDTEGRNAVVREVIERIERFNEDEADCYVLRWGGMPHLFPKEMFGEPKYMKFEDMEVPLPSMICEHLIQFYGIDWMYVPPHDERLVHTTIFDYDQPYEQFAKVILPKVNREVTQKKMVDRKIEIFDHLLFTHEFDWKKHLLEGEFIRKKLLTQIKEKGINISEAVENTDLDELREILKDYIRMQTQKSFIGSYDFTNYYRYLNPIFIDIGDKLLSIAMRIMINDGKYSAVSRLIKIRKKEVRRPIEPCLENIKDMVEGLEKVQTMIEFDRLNDAEELLNSIITTECNSKACKYKLELLRRINGGENTDESRELLHYCMSEWPDDGDFHKYKGDELFRDKKYDDAFEEYAETLRTSSNGLFSLELSKLCNEKHEVLTNKKNSFEAEDAEETDFDGKAYDNPWFKLLTELVEICRANKIEYFIGGGILYYLNKDILSELGPLPDDFNSIELVMDGVNARRLIRACRKLPSNRTLECVLSNPKLRSLDMYYIDTESTGVDFSRMDRRNSLGIALPIRIARVNEKRQHQRSNAINDKLWMLNYGYSFKIPKLTSEEREQNIQFSAKHQNGDKVTRRLFKNNLKCGIEKDTKAFYVFNGTTRIRYNAKLWKEKKESSLFGFNVIIPVDCERYLSTQFHSYKNLFHNPSMLIDASYADYSSERQIYLNEELWTNTEIQRQLSFKYSTLTEQHRNNWKMANEIFQGIRAENILLAEIDELKSLYGQGAYRELLSRLKDFDKAISMNEKYDVDIDPELKQLYYSTMERVKKYLEVPFD